MNDNEAFTKISESTTGDSAIKTQDKTVSVTAFNLPTSFFLDTDSKRALHQFEMDMKAMLKKTANSCPPLMNAGDGDIVAARQCRAEIFYASPIYTNMINRYKVSIESELIGGVFTEVITPAEGVPQDNQERVLINMHGGGFFDGSRTASRIESIPIAAMGKIKIVSVDYRMAPEHQFPAATDDVVAVYKTLLQTHEPENIGLYGCSAGAVLATQVVVRLQEEGLPQPAAIGMFCAAGNPWNRGDSGCFSEGITGGPIGEVQDIPYFKGVELDSPRVFVGRTPEMLVNFPPSLLITSTRDVCMSSVIYMHSQLIKQGREANLHVWEGLDHAFLYDSELPESREAYEVIENFFNKVFSKH